MVNYLALGPEKTTRVTLGAAAKPAKRKSQAVLVQHERLGAIWLHGDEIMQRSHVLRGSTRARISLCSLAFWNAHNPPCVGGRRRDGLQAFCGPRRLQPSRALAIPEDAGMAREQPVPHLANPGRNGRIRGHFRPPTLRPCLCPPSVLAVEPGACRPRAVTSSLGRPMLRVKDALAAVLLAEAVGQRHHGHFDHDANQAAGHCDAESAPLDQLKGPPSARVERIDPRTGEIVVSWRSHST